MEGEFWILKTPEQKANAAAAVANCPVTPDKPYRLKLEPYEENRRLAQNSLFHMWCGEISKQSGEDTPIEVKAKAKLHWGVPILVAENELFAYVWTEAYSKLPHEKILKLLEATVKVTSLMTVKQMSRFLTDMQRASCRKYQLTDPSLLGLEELKMATRAA